MAIKLGTENKNKTYAAIGLVSILAIVLMWFVYTMFFANPTPTSTVTVPPAVPAARRPVVNGSAVASPQAAGFSGHEATALPSASALDPTLHPEVMAQAEDTAYTGDGRNIFSPNSAPSSGAISIPKPTGPIRPQPVIPQGPPPPPPPPNIDLKFYAYYAPHSGGQKRVCLLHGEDIFIAAEGDIVDRRYKVVKINPFSVDVEDMEYAHTQTLSLSQN